MKLEGNEVVGFSYITDESRERRDAVNAKVMADPRMERHKEMPFDGKRMIFGGVNALVGPEKLTKRERRRARDRPMQARARSAYRAS